WLHILDDGFQTRWLSRDVDIVLISATDAKDLLLPGGRLREPMSSLRRADLVVLVDGAELQHGLTYEKPIFRARKMIQPPSDLLDTVVAFAGIARPGDFFADVKKLQTKLVGGMRFIDHHSYHATDVRRLLALKERVKAAGFLT